MQQLFAGFPVPVPDAGGGKEIKTYSAVLASTSSAETNLTMTNMTKIVHILIYMSSGLLWGIYTNDNGVTWRWEHNNNAITLPYDLYATPYLRLVSIAGNVIRYASNAAVYITVVGYQ